MHPLFHATTITANRSLADWLPVSVIELIVLAELAGDWEDVDRLGELFGDLALSNPRYWIEELERARHEAGIWI